MKTGLTQCVVDDPDLLGSEWDDLFRSNARQQGSRAWLTATISSALPQGAQPRLVGYSDGSGPLALFPMMSEPGRRWGSLTSPYTCLFQPLFRTDAVAIPEFGQYCRRWPVTRIDALDPQCPAFSLLDESLRGAGLVTRTFAHFGNWYEPLRGSWEAYLQERPGKLRETIRRKSRAAARAGATLSVFRDGDGLTEALSDYEAVYRTSWKTPEPYPKFNAALVRGLAHEGALRISVMRIAETPVAAQYWSVVDGSATILKLTHDETAKALSPGTVLTAATIKQLIETENVSEIDFGRGDDPYKSDWTTCRRPRVGMLAMNVKTPVGLRQLAIHDAGSLLRGFRRLWRAGHE